MAKFAKIADVLPGECNSFSVGDYRVAVYNVEDNFYAIEDRCPHRDGKLSNGEFCGAVVTCPLHNWEFNVITGECIDHPGNPLRKFDVTIDGDDLCIDDVLLESPPQKWDGVYRYLIRFGALGWVVRFGSIERIECNRGDHLVVQTDRGLELGEVLTPPVEASKSGTNTEQPTGEVVRLATPDEIGFCRTGREGALVQDVFSECELRLQSRDVPAEVIDGELLFDQETVVLYFLGEQTEDMGKLAVDLSAERDVKVIFQPAVDQPPSGGCGKPGCGGGGGCAND